MRLALGAVAGMVWAGATVLPWLYPAVRSHLASGATEAAVLAAAAVWIYGGLYPCALALVHPWLPRPRWLMVPAAWVVLEMVRARALGGAPWALLGHSQHGFLPVAQVAALTGVSGLSFLVLLPAAALAERGPGRRRGLAVWAVAMAAVVVFGTARLRRLESVAGAAEGVSVAVVGGLHLAGDPLAAYRAATSAAPPAALTVWPETAVPGYLQDEPAATEAVAEVARERGWLLLGVLRHEGRGPDRRYLNAALLLDPAGRPRATYAKTRLVPFAERSPWPLPPVVPRPFTAGPPDVRPVEAAGLRLGVLLCWEAIFPELARAHARHGAEVLVNLTSDRDVGAGALQQLAFSRFRAIETGRWLIRASGVEETRLIDPAGRIRDGTALTVPTNGEAPGLYLRHGEITAWMAMATLLIGLVVRGYERRGARRHERMDGGPPAPGGPQPGIGSSPAAGRGPGFA
jgi:apolipoprotein N-acyltransferase